ncbi:hypothetical protein [Streptomyces gilvus]|nr:hypothetical protein [Streptomyces sp. CME 23]
MGLRPAAPLLEPRIQRSRADGLWPSPPLWGATGDRLGVHLRGAG